MTKLQREILSVVKDSNDHLTADEVYQKVKKTMPTVALGSVYRNLNQFARDSLIRRVVRPQGPDIYESNMAPHNHLVCVHCLRMKDFEINGLEDYIRDHSSSPIISVNLTVNSICPKCEAALNKKNNKH